MPKREEFVEVIGSVFEARADTPDTFELTLEEVSEANHKSTHTEFSLIFHGPNDMPQAAMLYALEHETLGSLALHLSPFAQDENFLKLEARFCLTGD